MRARLAATKGDANGRVEKPIAALNETLAAAPTPAPATPAERDDKRARKQRKREAKLRREAQRQPDSWERFRILADLTDQGRRIVELADHKARYAMVVIGAINAGMFFLLSRAPGVAGLPDSGRPWLLLVIAAYAVLTVLFILDAIECLRPRELGYAQLLPNRAVHHGERPPDAHTALGILYWESISDYEIAAFQQAWSEARMEQLNAELVLIDHRLSLVLQRKYRALGRLYRRLALLVVLGAVLLTVYVGFAFAV